MADLSFQVIGARAEPYAAVPTILFQMRIEESSGERIQAIALRCQVQIQPNRRSHSSAEQSKLLEMFGEPARWGDTLKPLHWTILTAMVPSFQGGVTVDLPMTCTYDFEVAAAKYFSGLDDGEIPLLFLFSGTVFTPGPSGFMVQRVPWEKEAAFRLPVRAWREVMDHYFPNGAWIRLQRESLEALQRFKAEHALPTWDDTVAALLACVPASEVPSLSFELAQRVADAILYEGYVLYPYRASSSKNKVRFQWGVVAPREYAEAGGSEPWQMQTECLVEPGAAPRIELKVRGLQLQERLVEEATGQDTFKAVEFLNAGDEMLVAWDEGIEQELELGGIDLRDLARDGAGERRIAFDLPGGCEDEELRSPGDEIRGRLVRRRWTISAAVRLSAETVGEYLRLRVRIENHTSVPEGMDREEALRRSLVSAHTMLAVRDGRFISLLDPPPEAAEAVASCVNLHTWPVLAGPEGSGEVVLSSPIILYDHPAIAPESPNDLCDATEIDEILTLRIMTLTDEEKREARGTDPRARRIVDRADAIPDEILERLHGAVRSLRSVETEPPAAAPEIPGWEEFLNPPGETPPEEATLAIADVVVGKGSRVRLRPSRRADSMDFFLAGRDARVTGIYRDVEDECYVAVSLTDDDPTGDLHEATGRFFYFYPDEIEPLPAEERP